MSSEYMIRARLTILFFTILSLGIASLNSANARFAVILRDRAKSDYINTSDGFLDNKFQTLQTFALMDTVATALLTAGFAIYGALITIHPRWLRDHSTVLKVFAFAQLILAFIMIATGGSLADQVHGFQTSFEKFRANDSIPYYSMMYYGGVAQAAYGSVAAIMATVLLLAIAHYDTYRPWTGGHPVGKYTTTPKE